MSGPQRYQVTVDVEAWQWDGSVANTAALLEWIGDEGGSASVQFVDHVLTIRINSAPLEHREAVPGDWIIRGTTGSFFAKKPEEFAEHYMAVTTT